jgi:hypothetical protein
MNAMPAAVCPVAMKSAPTAISETTQIPGHMARFKSASGQLLLGRSFRL